MHILVTGGAGFIGSHVTAALLAQGHRVTVLDDFSAGDIRNLEHLEGELRIVRGCITDGALVDELMADVDAVNHQAALGSVPRSMRNPLPYARVNTLGFVTVMDAAHRAGVKRMAYASSSSVYGDSQASPKTEPDRANALSPYAASKQTNEDFATAFAAAYGMELVGFRYFNVFGPQQNPKGPYAAVIPIFLKLLLQNEAPTIHGDGEQSRDFTYVANVVQANLAALLGEVPAGNHVLNVACGRSTTVNRLFELVAESLGSPIKANHGPPRAGDVRHSLADTSKAKSLLGYDDPVSLEEGLKTTVQWYVDHPERLA